MDHLNSKRTLACVRCSDKRVKCNRQKPCSTCIKHNVDCEYRLRKQRTKRSTTSEDGKAHSSFVKRTDGSDLIGSEPVVVDEDGNEEMRSEDSHQSTIFKPHLLTGRDSARLVDNNLWSRIAEEVHSEEESSDDPTKPNLARLSIGEGQYVFGVGNVTTELVHPPPGQILELWTLFVENVDPLLKLTHIPSLRTSLDKSIANLERVPKPFEALMFSIYTMAVISVSDDKCQQLIGQSRAHCLQRFTSATRSALVRARFLSSTSLVTMQAFMLHILSIRHFEDPRAVWNITGLAFRIAKGMGLNIDGTLLGLSPFETEMRRRLWWQLKCHDFQAADLCGQSRFRHFEIDETTPKVPANINDVDLFPSMTKHPAEKKGVTEMIWNVIRPELSTFAASHNVVIRDMKKSTSSNALRSEEFSASDDMITKDRLSNEIEELVETKYLRYCDASKPLQLLTMLGARCATDIIRFVAHHPRRWAHQRNTPQSEKDFVWKLCLQILDRTAMMQSLPQVQKFAWITPYFIQWPILIHVLDTLRSEPGHSEAATAWKLVDSIYESNIELFLTKKPIFIAVGSLCLKAHRARMLQEPISFPIPSYILDLKRHHQKNRVRQARMDFQSQESLNQPDNFTKRINGAQGDSDPVVQHKQDDTFWLYEGIESHTHGEPLTSFDMDFDFDGIPDSDVLFGNETAINWDQWEDWLGNRNQ